MRNKRSIQNTVLQSLLALPLLFAFSCSKNLTDQLPEFFLFDAINPPLYSVSGAVSGLAMNGLILSNNGDTVTLDAPASDFVFPRRLRTDTVYNVAISKHPGDVTQSQLCTVVGGNGSIGNGDVGGVQVNCADAATIKVAVPAGGLQGTGLILLNNGGDPLTINGPIASATDFAFKTPLIATSNSYDVTVGTQPINPHQTCSVTGGTDTYLGGYPDFVPGISVDCVTNRYSISVNVTGLVGGNTLVLSNAFPTYPAETGLESYPATSAGSETLSVTANGVSSPFATKIRSGETYAIAIDTQPSGQTCVIGAPTGNVTSANIVVPVNCTKNSYFIQGTVTGLAGSNLRIAVTGGNSQTINVSGTAFTSTAIPYGTTYTLRILNPTNLWQTCSFIDEGDTGGAIDSSGAVDAMGMVWNDRISGGSMNLAGNITGIEIECVTNSFTIGGKIIGYPAGSYTQDSVLQLNGDPASNMTIPAPASGSSVNFVFPALYAVNSGSAYNVSVITNPQKSTGSTLKCAVSGNGTVAGANVTGVTVSCTPAPAINVTVTGFGVSPASNFTLDPDGAGAYPATTVNANGVYSFFVANGQSYNFNTPTPPNQSCSWTTASSGTMGTTNVALALDCTPMITSTSVNADAGTLEFDKGTGPFTITFNKNINLPVSSNSSTSCASQAIQISMVNAGGASVIPVNNNFTSCVPVSLSVSGNVLTVTPNANYMWYEATYKIRIRNSAITDTGGKSMAYTAASSCDPVQCYESATGFNTGGLVRKYDAIGGAYNTDTSRSGINLVGGTSTTTGVDGDGSGAMSFGAGNGLAGSNAGLPIGAADRTICGWVAPSANAGSSASIFLSYGPASSSAGYWLGYNNGIVYGGGYGFPFASSSFRLPLYSWTHVCSRVGGGFITLFLNGKNVGTNASSGLSTTLSGEFAVGNNSVMAANPFTGGSIDGVRIYNTALPERQIRYLATQVPTGLIARYDLAGDATDVSGFDNDLGGAATPAAGRFGVPGTAYSFSNQSLSGSESHYPTGTQPVSICVWARPTTLSNAVSTWDTLFDYGSGGSKFYFGFKQQKQTVYNSGVDLLEATWPNMATSVPFTMQPGSFNHYCAVYDGSTVTSYLNGSMTAAAAGVSITSLHGSLRIGQNLLGGMPFDGIIDDVSVYNRSLSLAEIRALVLQPNKRIFVTDNTYTGNLGGISGTMSQ